MTELETSPDPARHWAIVGGGMLGMTLALRLRQAGHEVTLFEQAAELGGLASVWTLPDGTVWDRHYHVILNSDLATLSILEVLGLDDQMNWVETRTGCYAGGELYSVSNTVEFLRFPPLSLIDKARLGFTIFYASRIKDWKKLERTPVERWLRHLSGNNTYESFWRPLLRSKLGDNHTEASAAFIWAIIQRLYAARRSGMKKEMVGYMPGGYATIIERFGPHLEELGVEIALSATVERIAAVTGTAQVEVTTVDQDARRFDEVVVTAAPAIASKLIAGLEPAEAALMDDVLFQGIVCTSLMLKRPLANFYTTNITEDWVPFTGVIEMTSIVDTEQFGGNHLVYLPRYTTADDEMLDLSDDEIETRFIDAVERMYPDFDRSDVVGFKVSRVRYVFPVSTLSYSESVPPIHTSVPGVHTLNSAHVLNGTLNVNETVQLAETHVDALVAKARRGSARPATAHPQTEASS